MQGVKSQGRTQIPEQQPHSRGSVEARGTGRVPVGVSPYVQVKGFIKEGVQLVPLALGGPGHHLGELVPGLQGELDEGVTRAWWGADISPIPPSPLPRPAGVAGHTGLAGGGVRAPSPPPPSPPHPTLLGGCRNIPNPAHTSIGHWWLQEE